MSELRTEFRDPSKTGSITFDHNEKADLQINCTIVNRSDRGMCCNYLGTHPIREGDVWKDSEGQAYVVRWRREISRGSFSFGIEIQD